MIVFETIECGVSHGNRLAGAFERAAQGVRSRVVRNGQTDQGFAGSVERFGTSFGHARAGDDPVPVKLGGIMPVMARALGRSLRTVFVPAIQMFVIKALGTVRMMVCDFMEVGNGDRQPQQ